jgi:thiosulfate/3-mercaptopyruvate sulfurtransferase
MSELLVSPEWLKERLGRPGIRVVDGSWYLPVHDRDAKAEFLAGHIPGAVHFDIDAIADHSRGLPHMLPSEQDFAEAASALGLSDTDTIVVYDGIGLFSAPRVWWTLRVFGAADVHVLDGGLPAWRERGYPLERGETRPAPTEFRARLARRNIEDIDAVKALLKSKAAAVVDARPAPRFRGEAPEPRPGVPSGHMPGAVSLPYDRVVGGDGRVVAPEEVRKAFKAAGVDLTQPVVTTCGSGVTAALLLFALATAGKDDVTLYDGSWAEWGSDPANPVATGPA